MKCFKLIPSLLLTLSFLSNPIARADMEQRTFAQKMVQKMESRYLGFSTAKKIRILERAERRLTLFQSIATAVSGTADPAVTSEIAELSAEEKELYGSDYTPGTMEMMQSQKSGADRETLLAKLSTMIETVKQERANLTLHNQSAYGLFDAPPGEAPAICHIAMILVISGMILGILVASGALTITALASPVDVSLIVGGMLGIAAVAGACY